MLVRCWPLSPLPLSSPRKHLLPRPDKLQPAQVQRTGEGVEGGGGGERRGQRKREEVRQRDEAKVDEQMMDRADVEEQRKERSSGESALGLRKSVTGLSLHWWCRGVFKSKGARSAAYGAATIGCFSGGLSWQQASGREEGWGGRGLPAGVQSFTQYCKTERQTDPLERQMDRWGVSVWRFSLFTRGSGWKSGRRSGRLKAI